MNDTDRWFGDQQFAMIPMTACMRKLLVIVNARVREALAARVAAAASAT